MVGVMAETIDPNTPIDVDQLRKDIEAVAYDVLRRSGVVETLVREILGTVLLKVMEQAERGRHE